jgi:hypothetical protein
MPVTGKAGVANAHSHILNGPSDYPGPFMF